MERVTWQELYNLQESYMFRTRGLISQLSSSPSFLSLAGTTCWLNPVAILKEKDLNDAVNTSQCPRAESRVERGAEWVGVGVGQMEDNPAPMPMCIRISPCRIS